MPLSSSGQGFSLLKAVTRVQIPEGADSYYKLFILKLSNGNMITLIIINNNVSGILGIGCWIESRPHIQID